MPPDWAHGHAEHGGPGQLTRGVREQVHADLSRSFVDAGKVGQDSPTSRHYRCFTRDGECDLQQSNAALLNTRKSTNSKANLPTPMFCLA
jgi:hypothetical protein